MCLVKNSTLIQIDIYILLDILSDFLSEQIFVVVVSSVMSRTQWWVMPDLFYRSLLLLWDTSGVLMSTWAIRFFNFYIRQL